MRRMRMGVATAGAVLLLVGGAGLLPAAPLERMVTSIPRKSFGWLPLYVGLYKGYFRQEGIEQQLVEVRPDIQIKALLTGSIDLAGVGSSVMRAAMKGAKLKAIIFLYDRMTFYFMARPEIRSVADLKGKRIGVTGIGSETDYGARLALRRAGVDPERGAVFLQMGPGDTPFVALRAGSIDATMLSAPANVVARRAGFNELLFMGDLLPIPFSGFGTTDRKLKEQPDPLKRWLRGMIRSLIYTRDGGEEVVQIVVKEFQVSPDMAREAYQAQVKAISAGVPGGGGEEGLRLILDIAQSVEKERHPVPLAQVVDFTLLKEAQRGF